MAAAGDKPLRYIRGGGQPAAVWPTALVGGLDLGLGPGYLDGVVDDLDG